MKLAFGSDEYYNTPGRTRGQASLLTLEAYQADGLSPLDVIRTATVNTADLRGLENRIGTLEAGRLADIIAVDGEPLKDVRELGKVKFVMKGGRDIRNDLTRRSDRAAVRRRRLPSCALCVVRTLCRVPFLPCASCALRFCAVSAVRPRCSALLVPCAVCAVRRSCRAALRPLCPAIQRRSCRAPSVFCALCAVRRSCRAWPVPFVPADSAPLVPCALSVLRF